MTEDQSVSIYYEEHGSEALVCSDSEEDKSESEEEKYEFSEGEDRILWLAFEEYGVIDEVYKCNHRICWWNLFGNAGKIHRAKEKLHSRNQKNFSDMVLEKRITDALDLLVFVRRLHGCSQELIFPNDKHPIWSEPECDSSPCSDKCYVKVYVYRNTCERLEWSKNIDPTI